MKWPQRKTIIFFISFGIIAILIGFPTIMLIIGSLVEGYPWDLGTFTVKHYISLLSSSSHFYIPLRNTILIGVMSTIVSFLIGVPLAWMIKRTNMPGRFIFEKIIILPLFISPLIQAMAWALLMSPRTGYINLIFKAIFGLTPFNIYTFSGLAWVFGIYFSTLVYLFAASAFVQMDPELEEASSILGASTFKTLRKITLPLAKPALLSSMFMVFVLSLGNFSIPSIIGAPMHYEILVTRIWRLINAYTPPKFGIAAALSMFFFFMNFAIGFIRSKSLGSKQYFMVGSRGYKPKVSSLGRIKYMFSGLCFIYSILVVFLPIIIIIISSLVPYMTSNLNDLFLNGITFENWKLVLSDRRLLLSIRNSLSLSIVGALLVIIISLIASYVIVKMKSKISTVIDSVSMLPAAMPAAVFAVGLLWALLILPLPIYGTVLALLFAYVALKLPYGVRMLSSSIRRIHPSIEEASTVTGSSWFRTMRKILIPLQKDAIYSVWVLLFAYMFRELTSALLLASAGNIVISVLSFQYWSDMGYSTASAVSLIQLTVIFSVVFISGKLTGTSLQDLSEKA